MRIPRIFHKHSLALGQLVCLDAQASQHLLKVLRLKQGDRVTLFNGDGFEYDGEIALISKREAHIRLAEKRENFLESPQNIVLVQGISRGDRMDFTIQKAVELGVQRIYPVITERTGVKLAADRRPRRQAHWQTIVHSACEQCGRNTIAQVEPIVEFSHWVAGLQDHEELDQGLKLVLHQHAQFSLRALQPQKGQAIVLFAGPEGGLSEADLRLAQLGNFTGVRLGPRVLRTETAAIAAMAVLQALWGDFS